MVRGETGKGPLIVSVIKRIIGNIGSGAYPVGKRLPAERRLCQELKVSRGTLRSALADLEALGTIERVQGSGTVVKQISPGRLPNYLLPADMGEVTLEGVHFARKTIELAALDYGGGRVAARELGELRGLVGLMEATEHSLPEFFRHDARFHEVLVRASGNPAIYAAYRAIEEYRRFLHVYTTVDESCERVSLAYHKKILAALDAGDKALAKRHLARHLNEVIRSVAGNGSARKARST